MKESMVATVRKFDKLTDHPKSLRSLDDANAWAEYILLASARGEINSSQAFAMQRMLGGMIKLNIELPLKAAQLMTNAAKKGVMIDRLGGWSKDMAPRLTGGSSKD